MPTNQQYCFAPEVQAVARPLISRHHSHLMEARLLYLYCAEPEKVRGSQALGVAAVKSGKDAWFIMQAAGLGDNSQYDFTTPEQVFLMTIWKDGWEELSEKQRAAVCDHELCHFEIEIDDKGNETYKIKPHDIEEFNKVLQRHGPYRIEVKDLLRALEKGPQLSFEEIAEVPEGAQMKMPPVPKDGSGKGVKVTSEITLPDDPDAAAAEFVNILTRKAEGGSK